MWNCRCQYGINGIKFACDIAPYVVDNEYIPISVENFEPLTSIPRKLICPIDLHIAEAVYKHLPSKFMISSSKVRPHIHGPNVQTICSSESTLEPHCSISWHDMWQRASPTDEEAIGNWIRSSDLHDRALFFETGTTENIGDPMMDTLSKLMRTSSKKHQTEVRNYVSPCF
jgi:hypothetical protein